MTPSVSPAAVVLDIRLPGLDGWDVLTVLKADRRRRMCPSWSCRSSTSAAGFALGAAEYLVDRSPARTSSAP